MSGMIGSLWFVILSVSPKVTVYQENLALVQESRTVAMKKGTQTLIFRDLPLQVDPTSIRIQIPGTQVLEQRYHTPSLTLQTLYQQSAGKPLRLSLTNGQTLEATYLATASGGLIVELDGHPSFIAQDEISRIDFPELSLPSDREATLLATVVSRRTGTQPAHLSYLTQGLSWQAYYDAQFQNDTLTLSGWVTITNTSGKTFQDATLQLVAGTIHRAQLTSPPPVFYAEQRKAAAPTPRAQAFFEYHLYPFPRPITIQDGERQHFLFLAPHRVPAQKVYVYEGDERVKIKIEFENKKETGLGQPLPSGIVRVFQVDAEGTPIFVGEDQIPHVPEGAPVRLYVGDAFDLKGESRVIRSQKIREKVREEEREVRLRNSKDQPVAVTVVQKFYGDWEIVSSSEPYQKRDAYTVEFRPTVPAHGETVIQYTVRWYW